MKQITKPLFTVSPTPHIHSGRTTHTLYDNIILALVPAAVAAVFLYDLMALRIIVLSCAAAMTTDAISSSLFKKPVFKDSSPLLIGLLFSFLLPASAPWWLVIVGSSLSVLLGRDIFGGMGSNPLQPSLVGWALCKISWPQEMHFDFSALHINLDYPLSQIKYMGVEYVQQYDFFDLFLGRQLGGIGAVQIWAVVLGAGYLLLRRIISPFIPLSFVAGVSCSALIFYLVDPAMYAPPHFHLLTGSVIFGAFFLATDGGSSPVGTLSMILYGLLGGSLVMVIRVWSIYPDGVPFALLLASFCTPPFDEIRPKAWGKKRHA